jgi:predicted TIM-barrel fold metal-dependent hydrolase
MDPSDLKYRPVALLSPEGRDSRLQFWLVDAKVKGVRLPAYTQADLERLSGAEGRTFATDEASRDLGNVDLRLEHMDRIGIDVQVLHNTMFIEAVTSKPAVEIALYKTWNRWLADISRQSGGRLRWSCMAPTLSMPDALDQIRFAKDNGACAVLMRPVEGERLLVDPYFYPLYDEASRLDMAIAVHLANGNPWLCELYGQHPVPAAITLHRFRMPTVMGFTDVALSEIPQVFPKLRWGFIEASSQWLPWAMHELKNRFPRLGRKWPENFAREYRMFVTCENSDDLPYIVSQAGEDGLVIGTDYGHTDTASDLDAIKTFQARTDVTPELKHKVTSDNPRALYGI